MLKLLFFSLHNRGAVGKIVGNRTCDFTVGAGNLKLFWFQVHSELQRKITVLCVAINFKNDLRSKLAILSPLKCRNLRLVIL